MSQGFDDMAHNVPLPGAKRCSIMLTDCTSRWQHVGNRIGNFRRRSRADYYVKTKSNYPQLFISFSLSF